MEKLLMEMETCIKSNGERDNAFTVSVLKMASEKLKEYKDAEEQGLLIRLPCKVGDTAYYVHKRGIDEVEVDSFVVNVNIFVNVSLYVGGERFGKTLTPYKTLFFTKKRSRKALEGMG